MEKNLITDRNTINELSNAVAGMLMQSGKLVEEEIKNPIDFEFGYLFQNEEGKYEMLMKVITCQRTFYFRLENGTLVEKDYTEEQYQEVKEEMKKNHECLREVPKIEESEIQVNRKNKNNAILEQNGIVTCPLKCRYDQEVTLKPLEDICKRALACVITIQESCDIRNNNFETKPMYLKMLDDYGVVHSINSLESRILSSKNLYTEQDLIDMDWAYEAYWALCWCLGFVDDITDASKICDCDKAIKLMMDPLMNPDKKSFLKKKTPFETFRDRCQLRSVQEILDMEDLYFRYTWAIYEHKVHNEASIGNLDSSVVMERHRALIWIISNINDWYEIDLGA